MNQHWKTPTGADAMGKSEESQNLKRAKRLLEFSAQAQLRKDRGALLYWRQKRMQEQEYTQTDMKELDRIALKWKNFLTTPEEKRYFRDQYTVVQLNQGGGSNTKRKLDQLLSTPDAEQCHRGHHGHCHLQCGLPGWIFHHHRTQDDSHHNLSPLTSQHTSWVVQHLLQKTSPGRPDSARPTGESSIFCFIFESSIEESQFERGLHTYPLPRALFQRFSFQTRFDAHCILIPLFFKQVRIVKVTLSSHPCWLALLECNGNHIHDLDPLWPICSHSFACKLRGVTEWLFHSPLRKNRSSI